MDLSDLDTFTAAYAAAALWSSTGDDGEPLDDAYTPDDLAPEARDAMAEDCGSFIVSNADDIKDLDAAQCGYDFWLTRNRHGAGFWDRGLGELGERLTRAAHAFGECWLYVGDDGLIYIG